MQRQTPSRRGFLGLLGAALACPGLVRAASPETLSGFAFGTTWRIVGPPDARLERLRPGLEALFGSIDAELSPWRSDSVASRFNASALGADASDELIHVTRTAPPTWHVGSAWTIFCWILAANSARLAVTRQVVPGRLRSNIPSQVRPRPPFCICPKGWRWQLPACAPRATLWGHASGAISSTPPAAAR